MSRVYLAMDNYMGKKVVIKHPIYNSNSRKNAIKLERLQIEAKVLCALNHPYIPRCVDSWGSGQRFHVVTDYVPAKSMKETFRNNPPSLQETVEYVLELLEALEYLHLKGVIHRDVKPGNILMGDNVVLIDFGAAEASFLGPKRYDVKIGTPGYQCPELFRGLLSPQCDIYSVGATMISLLSGKQPSHRLLKAYSQARNGLARVIKRAMNANPTNRFKTALEMKESVKYVTPNPRGPRIIVRNKQYEFFQNKMTIGRGKEADIRIDDRDRYVSPVHAEIHRERGNQFWIVDKSLNGTYIYQNETYKKIQRWPLIDGDIVAFCYSPRKGPHKILKFRAS